MTRVMTYGAGERGVHRRVVLVVEELWLRFIASWTILVKCVYMGGGSGLAARTGVSRFTRVRVISLFITCNTTRVTVDHSQNVSRPDHFLSRLALPTTFSTYILFCLRTLCLLPITTGSRNNILVTLTRCGLLRVLGMVNRVIFCD